MKIDKRKVKHAEFSHIAANGYKGLPVVVFDRPVWKDPTAEQTAAYMADKKIVEQHRGQLTVRLYEIGGQTDKFNGADISVMRAAIHLDLPDYVIAEEWNGAGCWTASFSIKPKKP